MLYYFDIHIKFNVDFDPIFIMSRLFSKLHQTLFDLKTHSIGIVFPEYSKNPAKLGRVLRIFGPKDSIDELFQTNFFAVFLDYINYSSINSIPSHIDYRTLKRVQEKTNVERLRRRQIRRHGLTLEEATEKIPDYVEKRLLFPFLEIKSFSTQQTFRIYLNLSAEPVNPMTGTFNSYGLSHVATVPWF